MPQKPPPVSVAPNVLKRDRLFRIIESARAGAGLWVSGMAGSGKTTLVASYLQENRFPSLWYQLDEGDADLSSFFYHFGDALRKSSHGLYRRMPLLTAEYLPGAQSFVSRYFVKLFSRITTPLWLVFDNYQDVPSDSGFNLVLMSIFQYAPPGVTVVVISRSEPPPITARMLARRKLTVIDSGTLAFTESESRDLVRKLAGTSISEDDVRRIHSATRGWVAGIILLLLKPENLERFRVSGDDTPAEIFDFFGSEVFAKLDGREQDFLLKTVLLPGISPEMADALMGDTNSSEVLERLARRNFFIETKLDPCSEYRYHPLFRRFLSTRFARRFSGEQARELQRRAGDLLSQAGRHEDAAALYALAREWSLLCAVIRREAERLIAQGRLRLLRSWIELLPQDLFQNDPRLVLWKGICTLPVDPEAGLAYCRAAYDAFSAAGDLEGGMLSLSAIVETSVWLNKPGAEMTGWIVAGAKYLEAARASLDRQSTGRLVSCMLAVISLFDPGYPRLPEWEALADALIKSGRDLRSSIAVIEWLSYLNCYRGQFETARTLSSWAAPLIETQEPTHPLLRWKIQECSYRAAISDAEGGLRAADQGLKTAEESGIHAQDFALIGHKVYFSLLKGDQPSARRHLELLGRVIRPDAIAEVACYNYLTCLEAFALGDFPKARELGELAWGSVEAAGFNWPRASMLVLLAAVHRACGDLSSAGACLGRARELAATSHSELVLGWTLFIETAGCFERGATDRGRDASSALGRAFSLATARGVLYHPAIGRETMTDLCARALNLGIEPDTVLQYIKALKLRPPATGPARKHWPWPVRAYMLGGFSAICGDQPLTFQRKAQKRPLELLLVLACCGPGGDTRAGIADHLWPEAEGDKAEQALSTTLHRLRKLLGSDDIIHHEGERLALSPHHCWVDAWHFEDLVALAKQAHHDREKIQILSEAAALYRGNAPAETAIGAAYSQGLQDKAVQALLSLGELHEHDGDWAQAVACYRRGTVVAPLEEAFYCRLMNAWAKQGNRAEVAAAYGRCRSTLEQELGIQPSKATTDLYRGLVSERESAE